VVRFWKQWRWSRSINASACHWSCQIYQLANSKTVKSNARRAQILVAEVDERPVTGGWLCHSFKLGSKALWRRRSSCGPQFNNYAELEAVRHSYSVVIFSLSRLPDSPCTVEQLTHCKGPSRIDCLKRACNSFCSTAVCTFEITNVLSYNDPTADKPTQRSPRGKTRSLQYFVPVLVIVLIILIFRGISLHSIKLLHLPEKWSETRLF